jgi:hypothetical protein
MKVNQPIKFNVGLVSQFGKAIAVILVGSILVHTAVMLIDFYWVDAPFRLSFETEMGAYGLFCLSVYLLWNKLKKAMLSACEKEIQCEKNRAVIESLQRITGLLAEHISVHNAEIREWVELKKEKGEQVSKRVEQASQKISIALRSLSEMAFVYPYTDNPVQYWGELENAIKNDLEINEAAEESA